MSSWPYQLEGSALGQKAAEFNNRPGDNDHADRVGNHPHLTPQLPMCSPSWEGMSSHEVHGKQPCTSALGVVHIRLEDINDVEGTPAKREGR
jgi:hypothetical protein